MFADFCEEEDLHYDGRHYDDYYGPPIHHGPPYFHSPTVPRRHHPPIYGPHLPPGYPTHYEGYGDYPQPFRRKPRWGSCVSYLAALSLATGVIFLLTILIVYKPGGTTTTTRFLFDCNAGVDQYEALWPAVKKRWCCENYGRGCAGVPTTALPFSTQPTVPPTPPPPQTTPAPQPPPSFFCNGDPNTWAAAQKVFCCQHTGRGCGPAPPSTSEPFDCNLGGVIQWPAPKRAYCCQTYKNGCDAPPPQPTGEPILFDCAAGYADWVNSWSAPQKSWCCQYTGKGCASTAAPFDCNVGGVDVWAPEKKQYCCERFGNGCPATTTTTSPWWTPTPTGVPPPPPPTTPVTYDCAADFASWVPSWSSAKKEWCCSRTGKGCVVY